MSPKIIIISVVVFLAGVVGLAFAVTAGKKSQPATANFSVQDQDRPQAETLQTSADLGEMKVSEVRQQDFNLKNAGTSPLQIQNINSSCNCTFGQIIYQGTTSKEYGMHAQSGFVTEVAPGDTATVRVIYRPSIMPVYGYVEREVYITTNDPVNPRLVFSVKTTVK